MSRSPQLTDFALQYLAPFPVASTFRRSRTSVDPVQRLGYLVGAYKMWLKFCGIVAICDYLGLAEPDPALDQRLASFGSPSLGQWNELWRECSRWFVQDESRLARSFLPELHQVYFKRRGKPTRHKETIDALIELRNRRLEHDSPPQSSKEAEALLTEIGDDVVELLASTRFFEERRFGFFTRSRQRPGHAEAAWVDAVGPHLDFDHSRVELATPLVDDRLALLSRDAREMLVLHPLVLIDRCPECRCQDHFLVFDQDRGRRLTHRSYLTNCVVEELDDSVGEAGRAPLAIAWDAARAREPGHERRLAVGLREPSRERFVARPGRLGQGSMIDSYQVLGMIKAGGMGEVYRARDVRLDRDVAIKVLPAAVGRSPATLMRFAREGAALGRLDDPGVVKIFEYGEHASEAGLRHFLVMEYVDGEDLEERLKRSGPLPPEEALTILRQVAATLDKVHAARLIHRDVKPGNVLVGQDGRTKLVDFGLVCDPADRRTDELVAGTMGTVGFMAPEQADPRAPIDARADVFGLAVTATQLLTGRLPGADEDGCLRLPVGLPRALEEVLRDALSREAEGRPASAGLLVQRIAEALERRAAVENAGPGTVRDTLQAPGSNEVTIAAPPAPLVDPGATLPPPPAELHHASDAQASAPGPPDHYQKAADLVGRGFGRWTAVRVVSEGAFGCVLEATGASTGRRVALKVSRKTDDWATVSMRAEEAALRAIHASEPGTGTLQLIEAELEGAPPWLALEWIEGVSLDRLLRERTRLPVAEALQLVVQVLDSLAAIHRAGVVHRDVKPSNVIIASSGGIRLCDLGIALPVGQTTDHIIGTPAYMSPEQADCSPAEPRSDVYAVGGLLFHMITGRTPFRGRGFHQFVLAHLTKPPPALADFACVSAELDRLVARLLAKNPLDRPTAVEAAAELRAILASPGRGSSAESVLDPLDVGGTALVALSLELDACCVEDIEGLERHLAVVQHRLVMLAERVAEAPGATSVEAAAFRRLALPSLRAASRRLGSRSASGEVEKLEHFALLLEDLAALAFCVRSRAFRAATALLGRTAIGVDSAAFDRSRAAIAAALERAVAQVREELEQVATHAEGELAEGASAMAERDIAQFDRRHPTARELPDVQARLAAIEARASTA